MNKVITLTLGVVLLGTGVAFAEDQPAVATGQPTVATGDQAQPAVATQAQVAPVEVGNKFCPISHEEVGKNGMQPYKVTYNGKVYNLCCKMCLKDFNQDPEKYSKMLDEEAAKEEAATRS